jgi:hypothetical protein
MTHKGKTMQNELKCLLCNQTSQDVPLINVTYKGKQIYICSGHLPVLIHEPQKLAEKLEKAVSE